LFHVVHDEVLHLAVDAGDQPFGAPEGDAYEVGALYGLQFCEVKGAVLLLYEIQVVQVLAVHLGS